MILDYGTEELFQSEKHMSRDVTLLSGLASNMMLLTGNTWCNSNLIISFFFIAGPPETSYAPNTGTNTAVGAKSEAPVKQVVGGLKQKPSKEEIVASVKSLRMLFCQFYSLTLIVNYLCGLICIYTLKLWI